ncbi:carbohydrate-binding protein [Carboxydochorda subterranea]|uniref:Carbohydrate-binding protein n=1 Tax=Carboxydichorda subterranea TaxID=3109565 RepID=A0ABZ1BU43_9FIRM|nr:carbohydrate-binding protein [Limnochorda sp. L945t]WRP16314.1 carbohydrate-binding protein [Limnochorda sp. L945t]
MAGLLQSLRRAFTGTSTREATPAGRPGDEEYGLIGAGEGHEAASAVAEERERPFGEVDDGVYVKPTPVTSGQDVTIWYSGLLARHGADQVFLHYGFGPGRWSDVHDVPMQKVGWIGQTPLWEAHLEAKGFGTLEFCFRDSADHWDNNNGHNWVYQIHWGAR